MTEIYRTTIVGASDEIVTVETGESGYRNGWLQVRCSLCGFEMWRSTQDRALRCAEEHADCYQCGGHCAIPCSSCFGHCESWCEDCEGHCEDSCAWCGTPHCELCCDICEGECESGCRDCSECHANSAAIHDYSYKPDPIFHGDGKLFVGMELEVSWPDRAASSEWLSDYVEGSDFWYAKADSSVDDGFEVVTHPMSLAYGYNQFPYTALDIATRDGAIPSHDSCGTHLHLSRDGLSGRQWWTLFAIHRKLPDLCGHIGGRGTDSSWANWQQGAGILANPIKAKKGGGYAERYVPLNINPKTTIELRYMAGDFTSEGVRRNLQWVDVLTTFGQGVPHRDLQVTDGALIDHIGQRPEWKELRRRVKTYA